jgi:hypothetical protein
MNSGDLLPLIPKNKYISSLEKNPSKVDSYMARNGNTQ